MARTIPLPPNPYPMGAKYYIAKKGPSQWRLMYHWWGEVPFTIGIYSSHAMAITFMDAIAMRKAFQWWPIEEIENGCE